MSETKPRKQKQRDPKPQPTPSGTDRLKTVVRRLPPNLPEAVFWQSVQTWVTDDTITWKSYFPGKFRTKRTTKEGVPSRAYIAFKNQDLVARFSREYDGHVFRDKAGNESQAIVEFAPYQKTPTDKKKPDARTNTIDRDDDYLAFLKRLEQKTDTVSLEMRVAASHTPAPTTTPLLEALKAEKLALKDRETILRSHAHYTLKKEEVKKVGAPTSTLVESGTPSKKARKAGGGGGTALQDAPKQPVKTPHARRMKERPVQPPPPPAVAEDTAQRKRPVVGLGRQFEAALNGAGVAVSSPAASGPPERKKRDKVEVDKGKRREDGPAVPSILQRSEEEGKVGPSEGSRGSKKGRGRGRGHRGV